jgi:hypothetical protein
VRTLIAAAALLMMSATALAQEPVSAADAVQEQLSVNPVVAQQQQQLQAGLALAVQEYLDRTARSWGYDNILAAATYAEEPAVSQFQLEGRALRAWRSLVWAACIVVLGEVQRGLRSAPTLDELMAALPAAPERP